MGNPNTEEEFKTALARCRDLFVKKMHDYGTAWSVMRPTSITDQLFIKAQRIRTLETEGKAMVDEGIEPEFVAIVNYAIMGMIALKRVGSHMELASSAEALEKYDSCAHEALQLMLCKNHDYGEAWRGMRISSFTDLILMKIYRTKQIEDNHGLTLVSEGVSSNYTDMMNYAVFALIKLHFSENEDHKTLTD